MEYTEGTEGRKARGGKWERFARENLSWIAAPLLGSQ